MNHSQIFEAAVCSIAFRRAEFEKQAGPHPIAPTPTPAFGKPYTAPKKPMTLYPTPNYSTTQPATNDVAGQAGQAVGNVAGQAGQAVGNVAGQAGQAVGSAARYVGEGINNNVFKPIGNAAGYVADMFSAPVEGQGVFPVLGKSIGSGLKGLAHGVAYAGGIIPRFITGMGYGGKELPKEQPSAEQIYANAMQAKAQLSSDHNKWTQEQAGRRRELDQSMVKWKSPGWEEAQKRIGVTGPAPAVTPPVAPAVPMK